MKTCHNANQFYTERAGKIEPDHCLLREGHPDFGKGCFYLLQPKPESWEGRVVQVSSDTWYRRQSGAWVEMTAEEQLSFDGAEKKT